MPLLDGSFPDTSKFFTEEDYCQYKVKRNDILESFNLLSIIEGTETNIQCKEGKIELICNNAKNNVKDVIVGEKIVGDDFGFNVNRELFSDIFKNMSEE